jgi:hypothetical protein
MFKITVMFAVTRYRQKCSGTTPTECLKYSLTKNVYTVSLFFLVLWGGVRLSPLGTSATNWPIVLAPDDRWAQSISWNENWQGKPNYSEETSPNAILSTTNPIWLDLGSNPGRRGGNPTINSLSFGMATYTVNWKRNNGMDYGNTMAALNPPTYSELVGFWTLLIVRYSRN